MKGIRAFIVHLLYNGYYCVLWWRLSAVLETSEFSKEGTIAAAAVLCIAFTVVKFSVFSSRSRKGIGFLFSLDSHSFIQFGYVFSRNHRIIRKANVFNCPFL